MGYPIEIPNSIPDPKALPPRGPFARAFDRLLALFARRKRRRSDTPARFGQGVDPTRETLAPTDAQRLDFDDIVRRS